MKKVLFMIPNLMHGGAEKVLVNLVNNMDSNKFDITVMTLFDEGVNKQFLKSHIKYISHYKKVFRGNSHFLKLFSPKFLFKRFVKEDYDIIVSYLEGPTTRIVSGCTNHNTKLVSWIHCTMNNKKDFYVGFKSFKEANECYSVYDKIICVSKDVKINYEKYANNKNCEVLYNINDSVDIINKSKENISIEAFKTKAYKLLGIGKIMTVKGFDRLARVHKKLIEDGYDAHTYILGVGNKKDDIESYILENNLINSFTFLGYDKNPYKYLKNCDLFVCSSYSEGFSTAATEALIVGTPVCTVEVSGMKEMLGENNEYGVVVENDDEALYKAIKGLLDNPQLLAHYKEKAIERGKYFEIGKLVREHEKMFTDL